MSDGEYNVNPPISGFVHPTAYSGDVLHQLKNWRNRHMAHTSELFDMAIAEIENLRAELARGNCGHRTCSKKEATITHDR